VVDAADAAVDVLWILAMYRLSCLKTSCSSNVVDDPWVIKLTLQQDGSLVNKESFGYLNF
jgi:hypothetical protein